MQIEAYLSFWKATIGRPTVGDKGTKGKYVNSKNRFRKLATKNPKKSRRPHRLHQKVIGFWTKEVITWSVIWLGLQFAFIWDGERWRQMLNIKAIPWLLTKANHNWMNHYLQKYSFLFVGAVALLPMLPRALFRELISLFLVSRVLLSWWTYLISWLFLRLKESLDDWVSLSCSSRVFSVIWCWVSFLFVFARESEVFICSMDSSAKFFFNLTFNV